MRGPHVAGPFPEGFGWSDDYLMTWRLSMASSRLSIL